MDHSIFCVAPHLNAYKMYPSENEANVCGLLFLQGEQTAPNIIWSFCGLSAQ